MKNQNNNQLQQFHSEEFGSLEIITIDGKPYFPATECAKILGYKNPQKAIRDHCKGVNESFTPSSGGVQRTKYIPEGDLYRLIVRSKLPSAERFERWVFDEVLPGIRKFGAYITSDTLDEMLRSPEFAKALMKKLSEERQKNAELTELAEELTELTIELTERVEEIAPKAQYCELILISKNVVPVGLIAKDYGMSAAAFNRLLHRLGVQYKLDGTWVLYQQFANCGYTQTKTYQIDERVAAMHTCWTHAGRLFLYDFLKWYHILPRIELDEVADD